MKETENNSNNSAEFNSRWCNAGGVNVNQWIKQRMDEINHENETALEEKVKKAALGCYYCGVAPPTLSKIFPVHLKFSPPIVEQIYTEWKAIGDKLWEVVGIASVILITSYVNLAEIEFNFQMISKHRPHVHNDGNRYYLISDGIDDRDPDGKVYRVATRGMLLIVLCLFPCLIPARTGKDVWTQQRLKLLTVVAIVALLLSRILFDVSDTSYTRSMNIWGPFLRILIFFVAGLHLDQFLVINILNTVLNLTWHYAFRPFSARHVFQFELLVFLFVQVQYYIAMQRERENFRRRILSYMDRKVSEELAAVHEFVAHHSRDVIALHTVDDQGYHRFTFVSSSIEAATGWSSEELVGRRIVEFVHDKDRENVEHILARASTRRDNTNSWYGASYWNWSYAKKLSNVQKRFSDVLTDARDTGSAQVCDTLSKSGRILPENGKAKTVLVGNTIRKSGIKTSQDLADEEWSHAIKVHGKFASLFSSSNRIMPFGFNYVATTKVKRNGADNETVCTDEGDEQARVCIAQLRESKCGESSSFTQTQKIPQMLQYDASEITSFPDGEELESCDDDTIRENIMASKTQADSYAVSSLPSIPEVDQGEEVAQVFRKDGPQGDSFSFGMISKSGTKVYMEASCNWTPQGVVAVYRDVTEKNTIGNQRRRESEFVGHSDNV